jgi:class 3 adenylate cyclase
VATHLLLRDTLKQIEERNAALDEKTRMLESLSVKLSKYLSPQVYASVFAGSRDVQLATERKRLTVFFSDVKDFVATTADMQPEDLTAMLNRYFTAMSKIALAHGAHIDKFIGADKAAADPGGILISSPTWALVRDIVRAEERGSIDAKGIRREVRVFAVAGNLDDHDLAPVARA